jgi:hypothetical protein
MLDRLDRGVAASAGLTLPITLTAVVATLVALVAGLVWLAGGNRHKPRPSGNRHKPCPSGNRHKPRPNGGRQRAARRVELLDEDGIAPTPRDRDRTPPGAEELRHGPATGQ